MATATATRRYTPEDLLAITDRPMPELVDGRLVERSLGQRADAVAAQIGRILGNHVDEHGLGLINGAQGSYQIFPDDPGKVRIPDVSFTKKERLPAGGPSEGHSRVAPDLVVEVISPNDTAAGMNAKVGEYLGAGVPLIWVADPDARTVLVFRGDGRAARLTEDAAIDGGDVLPGFRCPVRSFFEGI